MFESADANAYTDEYVVNRMFELAREGATGGGEYALLDAVIQSRLRAAYPVEDAGTPRNATAFA